MRIFGLFFESLVSVHAGSCCVFCSSFLVLSVIALFLRHFLLAGGGISVIGWSFCFPMCVIHDRWLSLRLARGVDGWEKTRGVRTSIRRGSEWSPSGIARFLFWFLVCACVPWGPVDALCVDPVGFRLMLSRDDPRGCHYLVDSCQCCRGFFCDNLNPFSGVKKLGLIGYGAPH